MAIKIEQPMPTKEELHQRRVLARILWHSDHKDDMSQDPAERKAAFDLLKNDYLKKAIDITRHLENNNLRLTEFKTPA